MQANIPILMKKEFKEKIDWFVNNYDKEIAGFITGKITSSGIVLKDLLIPKQVADSTNIDITGKNLILMRKEYGNRCKEIIGHWHSHHSMGLGWSQNDLNFINQYANPRDITVFVLSSSGEHNVRVEIRKPYFISLDEIDYEIEEIDSKIGEKLKKEIKKKITEPQRVVSNQPTYYYPDETRKKVLKAFSTKIKFYNKTNFVKVVDIYWFIAEGIMREFDNDNPIVTDYEDGLHREILFKPASKEQALDLIKDIKEFVVTMFPNYSSDEDIITRNF